MEIMTIKSAEKLLENETKIVELDQQLIGRLSRMDAIQQQNMSLATETNRKQRILKIHS